MGGALAEVAGLAGPKAAWQWTTNRVGTQHIFDSHTPRSLWASLKCCGTPNSPFELGDRGAAGSLN